jgi:quinone-modifying oxidoreductase subunit QmoC
MIRAGKREEVLTSDAMWMCTSCYNCIVRCPRGLPITHIMHGLANYAHRLGIAPKMNPTRRFAQAFWKNITSGGRVNELKLSISLYFMDGIASGIKKGLAMLPVGLGLMKTGRLNPMGLLGGHAIKGKSDLQKMLKKARELEDKRKGLAA